MIHHTPTTALCREIIMNDRVLLLPESRYHSHYALSFNPKEIALVSIARKWY